MRRVLLVLFGVVLLVVCNTTLQSQDTQTRTTPRECAKDVSSDTGIPVFFPRSSERGDLIWGLSTKSQDYQDSIPVILWVVNPTDKPSFVSTCPDLSYFWQNGIEVFDSSGRRISSQRDLQDQKKNEFTRNLVVCYSTFVIEVPPHTCKHTIFSKPDFDFYRDLRGLWDFQPGRYFIAPAERTADYVPIQRTEKPIIALEINIETKNPSHPD